MFVGPTVPDKCQKLRDPCLNRSEEIRPKVVGCGILDCFSRELPTGSSYDGVAVEQIGVNVRLEYGYSIGQTEKEVLIL